MVDSAFVFALSFLVPFFISVPKVEEVKINQSRDVSIINITHKGSVYE